MFGGPPNPAAVGWGLAAGIVVGLGIVRYYHGLTHGAMGWVATVMGAFSALVPLAVGMALGERPSAPAVMGVHHCGRAVLGRSAKREGGLPERNR